MRKLPGGKGKNLLRASSSLESPAATPRFMRHRPISTSSAPVPDCHLHTLLSLNARCV